MAAQQDRESSVVYFWSFECGFGLVYKLTPTHGAHGHSTSPILYLPHSA